MRQGVVVRDLDDGKDEGRRPARRGRRVGFVPGPSAEGAFVGMLRAAGVALIFVSVVGTFYGVQGRAASPPLQVPADMLAAWPALVGALAAQGFLSIGQWGSRQRARHDRRFWFLYLGLLALSAALNWVAYGPHLVALGVPLLIAGVAVIAGDALAELVIVADD